LFNFLCLERPILKQIEKYDPTEWKNMKNELYNDIFIRKTISETVAIEKSYSQR
jgi:hypothetical protein